MSAINTVFNLLIGQCERVSAGLQRLRGDVRPGLGPGVLRVVQQGDPEVLAYELLPVVFNLPERANGSRANLYVVVQGLFSFQREAFADGGVLRTHSFATIVAYFRRERESLGHVFGARYDFAQNQVGHPVFHAQIESYNGLVDHVRERYRLPAAVISEDRVNGMLRAIRIPTAQLDVFSLFLQLCADHLIDGSSGPQDKAAFNKLLSQGNFCHGAAFQVPRLAAEGAVKCYMARHWYPPIT